MKNYFGGNEEGLKKYLRIPQSERIYAHKDTTFFGSGKNGFVFTNRGIYTCASFAIPKYLSWIDFGYETSINSLDNNRIEIFHKSGYQYIFYCINQTQANLLYNFLTGIQQTICSNQTQANLLCNFLTGIQQTINNVKVVEKTKVEEVKKNKFDDVLTELFGCYPLAPSVETLKHTLNVKFGENVYLAHDASFLENGKRGTIVTDRGIYATRYSSMIFGHETDFTDWSDLIKGSLLRDGTSFKCVLDELTKTIYDGAGNEKLFEIYQTLQKKIKDTM